MEGMQLYNELESLQKKLYSNEKSKLLAVEKNIFKDILIEYTYHSNAIEGNRLSLIDTKVLIEDGMTVGKTMKDHLEALNHKEAILYIKELSQEKYDIEECFIKAIHSLILRYIDDLNAGLYRKVQVIIRGAKFLPPKPEYVAYEMEELMDWYKHADLHPLEKAIKFHIEFIRIHPFIDGNGRTGRLLMNWILLNHHYPIAIIPIEKREQYLNGLEKAIIDKDYSNFLQLLYEVLKASFEKYFFLLR